MLGFVKKKSQLFGMTTEVILFNTLVRSQLECASLVWNSMYTVHSQHYESIQRAFARLLAFRSRDILVLYLGFKNLSYNVFTLRDQRRLHEAQLCTE